MNAGQWWAESLHRAGSLTINAMIDTSIGSDLGEASNPIVLTYVYERLSKHNQEDHVTIRTQWKAVYPQVKVGVVFRSDNDRDGLKLICHTIVLNDPVRIWVECPETGEFSNHRRKTGIPGKNGRL